MITTPNGNQSLLYDDKGRLNQITSFDDQILKYTYDGSLPLSETWNGIINGALQLTYNNDFKVISSNLNGNILNYQYDNDGLLTKVGDLILTRDAQNGLLKETKLGNLTTQRTHSNFAELKEEIAKYSNNELYHAYYTRDKGGRITQKQEIINGISKTFEYRYDVAGRLVEVKLDNSIIETYQYDANGNRLNNNAIYDAQDRLLQYGSNAFTYSQNGDLKTKNNSSFSYDVFGNLRTVTSPEKTIDYVIDARNRRIGKKINGQLVQGFLYSGKLKPIAELDGTGNIVARFVYGSKINIPDYILKGNKTYRVISDHLGSPRLIVDISDGTIAQQLEYDTFGNILSDTNPNFQPFGFAGGLYDSETGLIRFGARDYDPQIGRWTIKDPILFDGGDSNLFGYVSNDPINAIDPNGLAPFANRSNKYIPYKPEEGEWLEIAPPGKTVDADAIYLPANIPIKSSDINGTFNYPVVIKVPDNAVSVLSNSGLQINTGLTGLLLPIEKTKPKILGPKSLKEWATDFPDPYTGRYWHFDLPLWSPCPTKG